MLSDSISPEAVGSPGNYFPVCDNPRPGQVAVVIQVNDVRHVVADRCALRLDKLEGFISCVS